MNDAHLSEVELSVLSRVDVLNLDERRLGVRDVLAVGVGKPVDMSASSRTPTDK